MKLKILCKLKKKNYTDEWSYFALITILACSQDSGCNLEQISALGAYNFILHSLECQFIAKEFVLMSQLEN
jgi:hypothetical protein